MYLNQHHYLINMFDYKDVTPRMIAFVASARARDFNMDPLNTEQLDYLQDLILNFVHDSSRIKAYYATWVQNPQLGFPIPDTESDLDKGLDLVIATDEKCYSFSDFGNDFQMSEQKLEFDFKSILIRTNFIELSWGFTDTRQIFSVVDYSKHIHDVLTFSRVALTK